MGDIVVTTEREVKLETKVIGSAPIEKVEIRNGTEIVETFRPYKKDDLGSRIRVIWSGSSFRGRERAVNWHGKAQVRGNEILSAKPINFFNPEQKFILNRPDSFIWESSTTGGSAGFDCIVKDNAGGELFIETPLIKFSTPIVEIGLEEKIYEAGGIDRRMRLSRLPDSNPHRQIEVSLNIPLKNNQDNPLYICAYQEDGHCAWSSPIYVIAK
jgi:hypothetical protein